jgi:DNA-binding transcriptional ArsR family regulator
LTSNKHALICSLVQREDAVFRALADPSRRAILERLTRGETAVKDLTARFDISQPAVSQHLAALRRAGLVSERREGRLVYYRVEPKGLRPLIDWIGHYHAFWHQRVARLRALLKETDE